MCGLSNARSILQRIFNQPAAVIIMPLTVPFVLSRAGYEFVQSVLERFGLIFMALCRIDSNPPEILICLFILL